MTPPTERPALRWIHPPVQGRSQQTLERLLDAAEQLLDERPFDAITVHQVAARAGSSVGSFYARFPNKEALLLSLQERYVDEARMTAHDALAPERWSGVPLARLVHDLCGLMVGYQREHRGLRRALVAGLVHSAELRRGAIELTRVVTAGMERLLRARQGEISHPDPRRAADFLHRILFAVLDQVVLFGEQSPTGEAWSDAELTTELTRACVAYLGIAPATAKRRTATKRQGRNSS